jgi:predicted nucleic acid-binding protein
MIALDSSALIDYLQGDDTPAAAAAALVLAERQACLPPVVLTEILSDPKLTREVTSLITALPVLEVTDGYWRRAGALRSKVLGAGRS